MTAGGGNARGRAGGFTLVETTFAVLVTGVLVVAVLKSVQGVARMRAVRHDHRVASLLAEELAAEAAMLPIPDALLSADESLLGSLLGTLGEVLGPPPDTRAEMDDLGDLRAWTESPPQDRSGQPLPGLSGWKRTATISPGLGLGNLVIANPDAFTVTVTVTSARGVSVSRSIVRTRNEIFSSGGQQLTVVTATLQIEGVPGSLRTAAGLLNRPPADGSVPPTGGGAGG